jgi:NhaP-type Na+/H+ or K+/H+ antiporter
MTVFQIIFSILLGVVVVLLCYGIIKHCRKNKIGTKNSPRTVFFSSVSQSEFVVTEKGSEKHEE